MALRALPQRRKNFSRGATIFTWTAGCFSEHALRLEVFTTLSTKGSHAPIPAAGLTYKSVAIIPFNPKKHTEAFITKFYKASL